MTSEYSITARMKNPLSWDEKKNMIFVILKCGNYPLILTEKKIYLLVEGIASSISSERNLPTKSSS